MAASARAKEAKLGTHLDHQKGVAAICLAVRLGLTTGAPAPPLCGCSPRLAKQARPALARPPCLIEGRLCCFAAADESGSTRELGRLAASKLWLEASWPCLALRKIAALSQPRAKRAAMLAAKSCHDLAHVVNNEPASLSSSKQAARSSSA